MSAAGSDRALVALRVIWARHQTEIAAAVSAIDDAVRDGRRGELDEARRERACGHAHRLAGTAGTFGFPAAGDAARELERALSAAPGPTPDEFLRLAELVVALRRALDADPV